MIYWGLQAADLLVYHTVHVFFLFGVFCWLVWSIRLVASSRYRPFEGETPALPVSVLVPSFNETLEVLESNLEAMLRHMSAQDEVLVLFDERDPNRTQLGLSDPRLRVFVAPPGKRSALRVGIEQARNPIFLVTGSDTQLTESTIPEILKPFADPRVGGVTGRVTVANDDGIGAKCYSWALNLRNQMLYPGMSRSGVVHVLNGECYAARTDVARELLDDFIGQTFLGKRFDSGDDGWMTTLLLREGHQTVYQSTAVAVTDPPASFGEFTRQQLRWNRNSTRRTLYAIRQGWAWRRSGFYPFHLVVTLVKTPLWIGLVCLAVFYQVGGGGEGTIASAWLEPVWGDFRWAFWILGIVMIRGLRGLPYLVRYPRALAFLPLYAFLCPFVLAPLRMWGMLTARNSSWLTRGQGSPRLAHGASAALLLPIGLAAVVLSSFPVVALALAWTEDDFDAY